MKFKVTSVGEDRFGLISLCERFAVEQQIAGTIPPEDAAAIVLDRFRRSVWRELDLLDVEVERRSSVAADAPDRQL